MDGLLIIDKPVGPTSHDVVARVRRALGESRIGHTGTLDPLASGVLPLVIGRATRLARFLSGAKKQYEAVVELGVATDTRDSQGAPLGERYTGRMPSAEDIERALDSFRGSFVQEPPRYSAKKVGGVRSYKTARREAAAAINSDPAAAPAPVQVWAQVRITACDGPRVSITVDCSAGFYVRSLAHDLGQQLGTGAHLVALRRTRSGSASLAEALPLEVVERDRDTAVAHLVPLGRMLPEIPARTLTSEGVTRVRHGRPLGPGHFEGAPVSETVRLLDASGVLVAIAEPSGQSGLLHPALVLM